MVDCKITADIGARNLLSLAKCTHYGSLQYYAGRKLFSSRVKWNQKFVVICKVNMGSWFMAVYFDDLADRAEKIYSFLDIESVKECHDIADNTTCFKILFEKSTTGPLIFSSCTRESQEEWITHINHALIEAHKYSSDSAYASGGSVLNESTDTRNPHQETALDDPIDDGYEKIMANNHVFHDETKEPKSTTQGKQSADGRHKHLIEEYNNDEFCPVQESAVTNQTPTHTKKEMNGAVQKTYKREITQTKATNYGTKSEYPLYQNISFGMESEDLKSNESIQYLKDAMSDQTSVKQQYLDDSAVTTPQTSASILCVGQDFQNSNSSSDSNYLIVRQRIENDAAKQSGDIRQQKQHVTVNMINANWDLSRRQDNNSPIGSNSFVSRRADSDQMSSQTVNEGHNSPAVCRRPSDEFDKKTNNDQPLYSVPKKNLMKDENKTTSYHDITSGANNPAVVFQPKLCLLVEENSNTFYSEQHKNTTDKTTKTTKQATSETEVADTFIAAKSFTRPETGAELIPVATSDVCPVDNSEFNYENTVWRSHALNSTTNRESVRSSDSATYENPENDYETIEMFEETEYLCEQEEKITPLLKNTSSGTFLVRPGRKTKKEICVKTEEGIKIFCVYEQDERFSLYKDFSNVFNTFENLLAFYRTYNMKSTGYEVKLVKGYKSKSME